MLTANVTRQRDKRFGAISKFFMDRDIPVMASLLNLSFSGKQAMLRQYSTLPVHIVEDHHHALDPIYRAMGSRHLPLTNNTLLHWDAHPDLLLPRNMPAEHVYDKQKLFDAVGIESWILPACFAGHFDSVYWVKPEWASQLPVGNHTVTVGQHEENIRVNSDLYYFISDGLWTERNQLQKSKELKLVVAETQTLTSRFNEDCKHDKKYVLDIDLDYFSTHNPFLSLFSKGDMYAKLKPLFAFHLSAQGRQGALGGVAEARRRQLEGLEGVFQHLYENGSLEGLDEDVSADTLELLTPILTCYEEFYKSDPEFDWSILLNAGLTCDDCPLPHHESTKDEIKQCLTELEEALNNILPHKPTLITIARSTEDDYCPKEQVEDIQEKVLAVLEKVYGKIEVHKSYLE